jgi:hypothetical protein
MMFSVMTMMQKMLFFVLNRSKCKRLSYDVRLSHLEHISVQLSRSGLTYALWGCVGAIFDIYQSYKISNIVKYIVKH